MVVNGGFYLACKTLFATLTRIKVMEYSVEKQRLAKLLKASHKQYEKDHNKRITLEKFARTLGIHGNTLATYMSEKSMPGSQNLRKIANYLDVSLDQLEIYLTTGEWEKEEERNLALSDVVQRIMTLIEAEEVKAKDLYPIFEKFSKKDVTELYHHLHHLVFNI